MLYLHIIVCTLSHTFICKYAFVFRHVKNSWLNWMQFWLTYSITKNCMFLYILSCSPSHYFMLYVLHMQIYIYVMRKKHYTHTLSCALCTNCHIKAGVGGREDGNINAGQMFGRCSQQRQNNETKHIMIIFAYFQEDPFVTTANILIHQAYTYIYIQCVYVWYSGWIPNQNNMRPMPDW